MDIHDVKGHLSYTSVKTTEIYLAFLTPDEAEKPERGSAQDTAQPWRSKPRDRLDIGCNQ
jgi:integrase/recombinase XerD